MAQERFEQVAADYERAAAELEAAVAHLRTTAAHFRHREVPRGCAHALAAYGHVRKAAATIDALAMLHAERSTPLDGHEAAE